jgi:hypothetical protein
MNLTSNPQFKDHNSLRSLRKAIHSARLLSLTKTKKWLNWLIDTGNVATYDDSHSFNNADDKVLLKNTVSIMVDCMNRKYGDNWDVHIETISLSTFCINFFTVFAETLISNQNELTHTIKDLVVSFPIKYSNEKVYTTRIKGTRITMFRKEYESKYCHSHLSTGLAETIKGNPFEMSSFCIGSGDLSVLESVLSMNFNARDFEAFLYEVDATVRWESLAGNPYVYIKDISAVKTTKATINSSSVNTLIDHISQLPLDFNFYISSNKYKIKRDHIFDQFVQNLIETDVNLNFIKDEVLCTYNAPNKSYYRFNSGVANQSAIQTQTYGLGQEKEKAYLIYNGEKKYFSIRANPKQKEQTTQEIPIIHPKFLEDVHTKLESLIDEKVTRCSAISHYHSAEYQPTNTA